METTKKGFFRGRRWFASRSADIDFSGMTSEQTQQALTSVMVSDILKERRSDRRWRAVRRAITALVLLSGIGLYAAIMFYEPKSRPLLPDAEGYLGVVRIDGTIRSSGDASAAKVVPALAEAFADASVKAVVISINSPGGSPVESERINNAVTELRKRYNKPVFAVIENVGASAGYMVAMHTDKIYAARFSLVGSIGAVLQTWDVHEAIHKMDIKHQVYASGELKNMLNPFSPPSDAAGRKAQELVNSAGGQFLADFKARRGSKLKADVAYDTGEVWSGEQALKIGLVDENGTLEQVAYANNANMKEFKPGRKGLLRTFSAEVASDWLSTVIGDAVRKVATESGAMELR